MSRQGGGLQSDLQRAKREIAVLRSALALRDAELTLRSDDLFRFAAAGRLRDPGEVWASGIASAVFRTDGSFDQALFDRLVDELLEAHPELGIGSVGGQA